MPGRKNRKHGSYPDEFACENCDATDKPPYRRGLCRNCYARQRHRAIHGVDKRIVTERIELTFTQGE